MNEIERNELLIRLEERMAEVCTRLRGLENELKERQCLLHTEQISQLNKDFDPKMCSTHGEKIRTIEKLVWISLIAGIGVVVKSFWSAITK